MGKVRGRKLVFANLASGQNSVLTLWSDFANVVSAPSRCLDVPDLGQARALLEASEQVRDHQTFVTGRNMSCVAI